jgi:orotidine-5'-phosphate decarboxylase
VSLRPPADSPARRIVFPLDVPDLAQARSLVGALAGEVGVMKVGLELYTTAGPEAVRAVHDAGAACFLDLKLHDIPETVGRSVAAATRLGVKYLTVHALGGPAMLARAVEAVRGSATRLLAVTVLTSHDDAELSAVGIGGSVDDAARRLGNLAIQAGIDGLVCSPHECGSLRRALGSGPLLMVPGVRPAGADAGDQKRIATPRAAIEDGADLLVIGRPIRDAEDRRTAARAIALEIGSARAHRPLP